MKTLAFLVFACVIAFAYFFFREQAIIKAQQERIEKLSEELAIKNFEAKGGSLELQEKCAAQAKRAFQDARYQNKPNAGYQNHYSSKLNKCFIEMDDTDTSYAPTIWTHRSLKDAFEGKSYGEYHWHTEKNKKYW